MNGHSFVLFCFSVLNDLQCKGLQSGQTSMDYSSQGRGNNILLKEGENKSMNVGIE